MLRWTSASADQEFLRRRLADCGRFLGLDADRNFRDTPAVDRAPSPMGTFCDSLCGGAIAEPAAPIRKSRAIVLAAGVGKRSRSRADLTGYERVATG